MIFSQMRQKVPITMPTKAPETSNRQVEDVRSDLSTQLVGIEESKAPNSIDYKILEVNLFMAQSFLKSNLRFIFYCCFKNS